MSRTYTIPDFIARCPQKSTAINPNHEILDKEYNQWTDTFALFDHRERTAFKFAQIPSFVSRTFPSADLKALRAIVDYMTVIICLDKANDMASAEQARITADMYITAFRDPKSGLDSPNFFTKLVSSLATRATAVIGEEYRMDYDAANIEFARATAEEAVERQMSEMNERKLTLDTYMQTRRKSVAGRSFLVYLRAIKSMRIPEEVLNGLNVKAVENAAIDLVIIANDVYSYKKELNEGGAPHNILTILMQDGGYEDLQQAIDQASDLFDQALNSFNEGKKKTREGDLEGYVDGMADIFVGNLEWGFTSPRYNLFESDQDREARLMRL